MPVLPMLGSFFRTLFRSRQVERDLDDELRGYVDALEARNIERGLDRAAARRAALIEVGGVEQVKEQVRDVRMGGSVETLLRDTRYGCRMIARSPGFSLVVVLTLALVIGANATVFSVIHAVLWRDLPYPEAERLVVVDADVRGVAAAGLAGGEAADLRQEPGLFDGLAKISSVDAHVIEAGDWERVAAASAGDDALRLLGGSPVAYGRLLEATRDGGVTSSVRSVVISHDLWRRRFHADPSVIGRHVEINNLDVEVVGVLRPDFRVFLPANSALPETVDVWFPSGFETDRRARGQITLARLAPGVSLADAQARLDVVSARFLKDHAADYADGTVRLHLQPLSDVLTAGVRRALWVLGAAVFFVLLIGCVNVGNLMLARARARAPEIAVRRALGAGRSRLVAQLFTESALLAIAGAAAGFLLAYGGIALVEWLRPSHLPRQSQIGINGAVAVYTAALSVVVSIVFGLMPAFLDQSKPANEPLGAARSGVQRSSTRRLQRSLVMAEVALSIIPLVAAGLMLRTFVNLTNAPIGFDPTGLQTAKIAFSFRLFPDVIRRLQLHRDALDRVRALPGVEAVSLASPLPFDEHQFTRTYGRSGENDVLLSRATLQTVFPGYLEISGTKLRAGRDFTADDLMNQRPVVIIDERMAAELWSQGAVGQRLTVSRGRAVASLEVIGVANHVRMKQVREDSLPTMLVPYHFFPLEMALVIKTKASAEAIAPAVKQAVESLGTRRPVYDFRPMRRYVDHSIGDARFLTLVLIGFGAASLLLAAVGLYGTLAYLTSQRTQEFGVRLALGASAGRIVRSVAGEGLRLTALGAAAGFAGAAAVSSWLGDLLYEVTPFDGTTVLGVCVLVGAVAVVAALYPAWRAAGVDPVVALRAQ
jgi:predicted permease